MTLLEQIKALPPELLATKDTKAIAEALPVVVSSTPTEIGNGLVLSTIGLVSGNNLLDVIATTPIFRYVKPLLDQGRLDVSSALVSSALDDIAAAGVITHAEADAIKGLALVSTPVEEMTVRCLCWSDNGEWLV